MENYTENVKQNLIPEPFLILINSTKQSMHARKIIFKKPLGRKTYLEKLCFWRYFACEIMMIA